MTSIKRGFGNVAQYAIELYTQLGGFPATKDFDAELIKGELNKEMWSMIGGNCALCEVCKVRTAEPCSHPDEARTSLESLAINVVGLLKEFGMDSEFRSDRITWTGCILY